MFRKLLAVIAGLMLLVNMAWAAVDANTATKEELDAIKGIGPSIAQRIVDERKANGPFKSLADLQSRVKGVGEKTIEKMAAEGLTVGGGGASKAAPKAAKPTAAASPAPAAAPAAPAASAKTDKKAQDKAEKADKKAEAKAEKAEAKADKKAADKPAAAASAADAKAKK